MWKTAEETKLLENNVWQTWGKFFSHILLVTNFACIKMTKDDTWKKYE